MLKSIKFIIPFFIIPFCGRGQSIFRAENTATTVLNGTFVHVVGSFQFEGVSQVQNQGNLLFTQDWINNSAPDLQVPNMGEVELIGTDQIIGGSQTSTFHILSGTEQGPKSLENSIEVDSLLNLNDARLITNEYFCAVIDPDVNAITWNIGYVETNTLEGSLRRNLANSNDTYVFPLGNQSLAENYRPIIAKTSITGSNLYASNLALGSVDNGTGSSTGGYTAPFSSLNKAANISTINENFYHTFTPIAGPAQNIFISIPYFTTDESDSWKVNDIAQYNDALNNSYQWNLTNAQSAQPVLASLNNPEKMKQVSLSSFETDALVLSGISLRMPEVITPNDGNNENDFFVIEGLQNFGSNNLLIFDRWGNILLNKENYQNDWKGTNEVANSTMFGKALPTDTYYYTLKVEGQEPISGFFEIVQ